MSKKTTTFHRWHKLWVGIGWVGPHQALEVTATVVWRWVWRAWRKARNLFPSPSGLLDVLWSPGLEPLSADILTSYLLIPFSNAVLLATCPHQQEVSERVCVSSTITGGLLKLNILLALNWFIPLSFLHSAYVLNRFGLWRAPASCLAFRTGPSFK